MLSFILFFEPYEYIEELIIPRILELLFLKFKSWESIYSSSEEPSFAMEFTSISIYLAISSKYWLYSPQFSSQEFELVFFSQGHVKSSIFNFKS